MNPKKFLAGVMYLFVILSIPLIITATLTETRAQNVDPEEDHSSIQADSNAEDHSFLEVDSDAEEMGSLLTIERADVCTSIVDREPQGIDEKFPASVGKIYFFTQVLGAEEPTTIYHRWYYEGNLMAKVELPVNSINWRTYSSKQIMPDWIGNWSVEAADATGQKLKTLSFEIH
ncbi:MAG: DUF2914 domain-containing protein [bacterium]